MARVGDLCVLTLGEQEKHIALTWWLACAIEPNLEVLRVAVEMLIPIPERLSIIDAEIKRRARMEAEL